MLNLKGLLAALAIAGVPWTAQAATLNFAGDIDVILEESGTSELSVLLPVGTPITGAIDDETFNGSISGPPGTLVFGCCIAAGGLEITDDIVLGDAGAALLNSLDSSFAFLPDQMFDLVDIEGDVGDDEERIEVGVSLLYSSGVFDGDDPSQYPPGVEPVLGLFFILQEIGDEDVYSAIGLIDRLSTGGDDPTDPSPSEVPLPAGGVLLLSGLAGLVIARRRGSA